MRGIGQPMWPGRRPEELVECQLHEALLNVAVDPEIPFWLICPYDAEALSPAVVAEVQRSHPVIVEAASYQGSIRYAGRAHLDAMFAADLTVLVGQPIATGSPARPSAGCSPTSNSSCTSPVSRSPRRPRSPPPSSSSLSAAFIEGRPRARYAFGTSRTR
jgi:hypothetical protein